MIRFSVVFACFHRCFLVPDHNCSAVCWNFHNCPHLRHKEQSSTSTLHQFSQVRWVKNIQLNSDTSFRRASQNELLTPPPPPPPPGYPRPKPHTAVPLCCMDEEISKPVQEAGCDCILKTDPELFETAQIQVWFWRDRCIKTPSIQNALVVSCGGGQCPWPVRTSAGSKGHTWVDSCWSRRGIKTQRWNDVSQMKDADSV